MIKITNIGTSFRNNWILETPVGIIAVDTGMPLSATRFLNRFKKRWTIDKLKYVFLTHAHNDHAGFLSELLQHTTVAIVLSESSRQILADGHPNENHEYTNWLGKILERVMTSSMGAYPTVTDTSRMRVVRDDDGFFEEMGIPARAVFLPGHTSDSIGLHLYEDHVILCGDAALNLPLLNANRHTVLIENNRDYHASWDKMISLNPQLIYPGHGKPFPATDLKKYRDIM